MGYRVAAAVEYSREHDAGGGLVQRSRRRSDHHSRLGSVAIAGIAGDQQSALFGQLCLSAGRREEYLRHRLLPAAAHRRSVRPLGEPTDHDARLQSWTASCEYALEGCIFIGGAVVQWLRDSLALFASRPMWKRWQRSVPDNGGVVFVPAFVGLGAPHWDPYARGLLIGLERGTQPGHIARAALESIAFQVADVHRGHGQGDGKSLSANCASMAARQRTIC